MFENLIDLHMKPNQFYSWNYIEVNGEKKKKKHVVICPSLLNIDVKIYLYIKYDINKYCK